MNAQPRYSPPPPARPNSRAPSAWWVLGAPLLALPATVASLLTGAPGDWIGAVCLVAVFWTVAASLAQALRAGLRHGDWSAFSCADRPCESASRDDDHDWATRTGAFAYLRVRDRHEALMREGDPVLSTTTIAPGFPG